MKGENKCKVLLHYRMLSFFKIIREWVRNQQFAHSIVVISELGMRLKFTSCVAKDGNICNHIN